MVSKGYVNEQVRSSFCYILSFRPISRINSSTLSYVVESSKGDSVEPDKTAPFFEVKSYQATTTKNGCLNEQCSGI